MKLNEIRERKALKVAEARALAEAATAQARSMTEQEIAAFDTIKAAIQGLEQDEARATFLHDQELRSNAVPVDKGRRELESRINLVDAIVAQVENRSVTGALAEFQAEYKRMTGKSPQGVAVPQSAFESRSTQTTTTAAGIVPEDFKADQFIGLLRNAQIVKSLGARVLPGLRGDAVIPKQLTASTAYWIKEGQALTESGLTFGNVTMRPRHVGALASWSRQLLQQSNPGIEQMMRDDFSQVIGLAIDKALVVGDGDAEPLGLLEQVGIQTASLATLDWASIKALLLKLKLVNASPNAILTNPTIGTKLETTLKAPAAGAGYLAEGGKVAGLTLAESNHCPAGTLIAGDFSQMVIGTWGGVDLLANPYAPGYYERGDVQLRILTTMDMCVRNPQAFVVAEDVAA